MYSGARRWENSENNHPDCYGFDYDDDKRWQITWGEIFSEARWWENYENSDNLYQNDADADDDFDDDDDDDPDDDDDDNTWEAEPPVKVNVSLLNKCVKA